MKTNLGRKKRALPHANIEFATHDLGSCKRLQKLVRVAGGAPDVPELGGHLVLLQVQVLQERHDVRVLDLGIRFRTVSVIDV